MPTDPRLRPRPVMKPRFTLGLLYLFGFFFVYCFILIAPELAQLVRPAGPEDEEAMKQAAAAVAREAAGPRLLVAFLLAVGSVGIGMYRGILPGTSE